MNTAVYWHRPDSPFGPLHILIYNDLLTHVKSRSPVFLQVRPLRFRCPVEQNKSHITIILAQQTSPKEAHRFTSHTTKHALQNAAVPMIAYIMQFTKCNEHFRQSRDAPYVPVVSSRFAGHSRPVSVDVTFIHAAFRMSVPPSTTPLSKTGNLAALRRSTSPRP